MEHVRSCLHIKDGCVSCYLSPTFNSRDRLIHITEAISDLSEILVGRRSGVLKSSLLALQQLEAHHALQIAVPHVSKLITL